MGVLGWEGEGEGEGLMVGDGFMVLALGGCWEDDFVRVDGRGLRYTVGCETIWRLRSERGRSNITTHSQREVITGKANV